MNDENYLSKKFYRKKRVEEVEKKLKLLGVSTKLKPFTYLNIQTIGTVIIFTIGLFIKPIGFIVAPLLGYLYYKGISYFLVDKRIENRRKILEEESITFFEILTLSLETGRNLQEALKVTIESSDCLLVEEFKEVLREVKYGKSLTEAMRDMTSCIPSDTINNIITSLTDANIYGGSIIDSLHTQLDYLREKRKDQIKEEINKVPIKISIISVFFFIPLILLIILAPVLLTYIGS